ncbi:hypothetical protein H8A95_15855 [Bradyrhizobium sp. Pear76]|uniref:hypothetical protein n=1 Tax=Bradyrhizobium oropedii TaxID=1571201 RepID=UPI001E31E01C|nr:hypothetical protein [Bradyrhizobium oropedii]MCC8963745.1 hypothetical protein [Bradyrhizobium oropedii]
MRQLSDIRPGDRVYSEQEGARRAAAARSFWSDHPLNLAFRAARQVESFNLKDFTAFVLELPADQFQALTGGRDAR